VGGWVGVVFIFIDFHTLALLVSAPHNLVRT
jgi:hypothetical protein